MREIKFRAWDGEKMLWPVYDLTVHGDDPIMQFTGLLDRNGVEIYEGDIVAKQHIYPKGTKNGHVYKVVKWMEYKNGFNLDGRSKDKWEIVGNIYENPELKR